jgi:hypothetical protein
MKRIVRAALAALLGAALLAPVAHGVPRGRVPDPAERAKLVACDNTSGKPNRPRFCTAQTLQVTSGTDALAQAVGTLESSLGLEGRLSVDEADGAIRFMDPDRFQHVPTITLPQEATGLLGTDEDGLATTRQVIDLAALLDLDVLDAGAAVARLEQALAGAGLLPEGAEPLVSHSTLELTRNPEALVALPLPPGLDRPIQLDTQVNYPLTVGDPAVPVIGPGAKIKASFDGDGNVTQFLYSAVQFERGGSVPIVPPEQGPALCAQVLDAPADATVRAQLVYVAPAPAAGASRLLPHFRCAMPADGHHHDHVVDSREVLLPAVVDAPKAVVTATPTTLPDGTTHVSASVAVTGGTAPFTYQWSSATTTLPDDAQGDAVGYAVAPRAPLAGPLEEELLVTVTDADGLVAVGRSTLTVTAPPVAVDGASRAAGADAVAAGVDVATEWVGTFNHQGDLPGVPGNASGFRSVNGDQGVPIRFNWGNNDAFEVDFKDPALGGQDTDWVDSTDMLFYSGHANGNGWVLESEEDDQSVRYEDARYGNHDLEWLVLGACGSLQSQSDGKSWDTRWGPAFRGLHMMLGYASISQDTTEEGRRFSEYMHGLRSGGVRKLYQAWGQQAIDLQPATDSDGRLIRYAYGGPVGADNEWNAHDYFPGKGPITADIDEPAYFWVTRGTT